MLSKKELKELKNKYPETDYNGKKEILDLLLNGCKSQNDLSADIYDIVLFFIKEDDFISSGKASEVLCQALMNLKKSQAIRRMDQLFKTDAITYYTMLEKVVKNKDIAQYLCNFYIKGEKNLDRQNSFYVGNMLLEASKNINNKSLDLYIKEEIANASTIGESMFATIYKAYLPSTSDKIFNILNCDKTRKSHGKKFFNHLTII